MLVKIGVLLVTVFVSTHADSIELCQNEIIQASGNYFEADNCLQYKLCISRDRGFLMNCPFPTIWGNTTKSCIQFQKGLCTNDVCANLPDQQTLEAKGHCRGFWECENGAAVPKCCPFQQRFNGQTKMCEPLPEGMDPLTCTGCPHDVPEIPENATINATTAAPEPCNKIAVGSNAYNVTVAGFANPITMQCSVGTAFDPIECGCTTKNNTIITPADYCPKELFLPFTENATDLSPKRISVEAVDVTVDQGSATFHGVTSKLILQRFNNIEHKDIFIFNMKYSSNHQLLNSNQSLVSNDNCPPNLPSVVIVEDASNVYFSVGTKDDKNNYEMKTITIAHQGGNDIAKNIDFKLVMGTLTATVNGVSDSVLTTQYLNSALCELTIGASLNADNFEGSIDEISIYLCVPDAVQNAPNA